MHACDALNAAKSHAIDIHFQALGFDLIRVSFGRRVDINELATTIYANVILFTSAFAILTGMAGTAFGTLHQVQPQFIAPLCNAKKTYGYRQGDEAQRAEF
jgi:hypothetical protein